MKFHTYLFTALTSSLLCIASYAETSTVLSETKEQSTHSDDELRQFEIGVLTINQLNFKQAINKLISRYETICEETQEHPLTFHFEFPSSKDAQKKMSFNFYGNLEYQLNQISEIYGYRLEKSDDTYRFIQHSRNPEIVTKSFRVPPDFDRIFDERILHGDKINNYSHDVARSVLIVRGELSSVSKIERLLKNTISLKPLQIKATIKKLSLPSGSLTPELKSMISSKSLTAGAAQMLLRTVAQTEGANIATFPSMVIRSNDPSTMEFLRELHDSKPHSAPRWIGYKYTIKANFEGLHIRMVSNLEYHHTDGFDHMKMDKLKLAEDIHIEELNTNVVSLVKSQHYRVFRLKSPDTSIQYLLVGLTKIDATGKAIPSVPSHLK